MDMDILPASDDRIFKLLLSAPDAKPALISLIHAITNRPVVDVTVRNNEPPKGDTDEKAERLDVNCVVEGGSQIDLEMQASRIREDAGDGHNNLVGKSIYYICDLHASQSSRGKKYSRLARSYQVTFCMYNIFPKRKEFVNPFSFRHDTDYGLLSNALQIVFVELNKLKETVKKPVSEMTELEKWSVFLKYADNPDYRKAVNEIIESEGGIKVAATSLMKVSKDDRERAIQRSRRMYQTDLESNMLTAESNGIKKGLKQAKAERKKLQGVIADKDAALADKDAALADQAALIAELRAKLGEVKTGV
jgi:predicted transposase/invertase (TIGR01784 family)